jgi:hypothetical protein
MASRGSVLSAVELAAGLAVLALALRQLEARRAAISRS